MNRHTPERPASQTSSTSRPRPGTEESPWATSGTVFAGVMMLVGGILGILNGIAAIATNDVYARIGSYVYEFSLTAWGWIHLVIGVLLAVTGYFVLKGADWARGVGIGLTVLFVIEYFMFLPYAPVWSIVAIALGAFVIWALAHGPGRHPVV
ncbi:hypothetical protein ACFY93_14610 [Streptomyces sp. NPDC008313]|uniref:DUF7144 family membrane protein n=1 Tax=Streptomyces sp. NPDC008313 TaxID=3364826 RepID=UPI0036EB7654